MTLELFAPGHAGGALVREIAPGAHWLNAFACPRTEALCNDLQIVLEQAPLRQMQTARGFKMSVAMSNCGMLGWLSDLDGYRYSAHDPLSGRRWPSMPKSFSMLAQDAAQLAGYRDFVPDACLINEYGVGARMSLHQDKNERQFDAPIVSISLGLPAIFLFGGLYRSDPITKYSLMHGDVVVWGGPSRLRFHGVQPVKPGVHSSLGARRINLTFRIAGPL